MKQPILNKLVGYPLLVTALIGGGAGPQSFAQAPPTVDPLLPPPLQRMIRKTTNDQRKAAAAAAAAKRAAAAKVAAPMAAAVQGAPMAFAYPPGVVAPPGVMNPRGTPDYMGGIVPNWARSPIIRKFVNTLPGLGPTNANNLGNFIPIATKDTTTYPGSDYYNIGVVDYTQQLHSDLPATKLRGYKDLSPGADGQAHYLGPVIIAQRDRPVRVKFQNLLPLSNAAGTTFLPVDSSAMGAGPAPGGGTYTENRAELHLHGGLNPWISDGTPHQWITPAGDPTPFKKGESFADVPDMPATTPGDGTQYYYYTNQQSGRFLFYHDHSYGLTRLNVYAGEASGYLIVDPVDDKLIDAGVLPGAAMPAEYRYGIPLIIQDKGFVPGPSDLAQQDPTWDEASWGGYGSLWFPHVYMPNQDPSNSEGANPMGRWDYGPWFWPAVPVADPAPGTAPISIPLAHGPKSLGVGLPDYPGTPNPSLVPEGFMDTTMVNGTPYPTVTVEPKAYRFRILNGSNDRPYSLSFYKADASGTEVTMIPATPEVAALGPLDANGAPLWPADGRDGGVVSYATKGPDIIQIGTESGFLPTPVVIPPQPTTYNMNRRDIVVLNIANKALFLMPAERADVVVDFSAYAGQTLILYNDMLAPVPAFDVRFDYFTNAPDQTTTGGAPPTLPGYGPNTRTLMQIKVAATAPAPVFNLPALEAAFTGTSTAKSAFAEAQHPPIVPQTFYNSAMNTAYTADTYGTIQGNTLAYTKTENGLPAGPLPGGAIDLKPKAIHELFELDYGRMNAILAVELPLTNFNNQTTIPLAYTDPTTEVLKDGETQLWKITHNGVDTHPVHFHLFDVQIVNRVGWDGAVRFPDPNERGWKETVKMNPLEDIIVALRPLSPRLPFTLSNSNRPLNVTKLSNESFWVTDMSNVTPVPAGNLGNMTLIPNTPVNFGWEYVWHCHILGHEENDFMRAMQLNVAVPGEQPFAPTVLTATAAAPTRVDLAWTDNSTNEVGFTVQRRLAGVGSFVKIGTTVPDENRFTDMTTTGGTAYDYRVLAYNQAGDSAAPTNTATLTPGVVTPATSVALVASPLTSAPKGTAVAFIATPTGGSGHQFEFRVNGTVVQPYGSAAVYNLPLTQAVGTYTVQVNVRTSLASPVVTASIPYTITPLAATGVQLLPNLPSPQNSDKIIVFTAAGIGSANYQYQFSMDGTVAQAYSSVAIFTLPAAVMGAGGSHAIKVDVVTSLPAAVTPDATATVNYTINAIVPTAPTGISPNGINNVATPTYTFNAVAGATDYYIYLWDNQTLTSTITRWYTAAEVGTPNGAGIASIPQTSSLVAGSYAWFVRARNSGGTGDYSIPITFIVGGKPAAPVGIEPAGTGIIATPTYTFNAVAGATGYSVYLWDNQTNTSVITRVYTAAEVGAPTGTGIGSIPQTTPLVNGSYAWFVRAINVAGFGPYSNPVKFIVGALPAAPVGLGPTGTGVIAAPTYTFNAVAGATGYSVYLWDNQTNTSTITRWYSAAEVGAPVGTGVGSITQVTPLVPGSYAWFVRAQNGSGTGPYSIPLSFIVP